MRYHLVALSLASAIGLTGFEALVVYGNPETTQLAQAEQEGIITDRVNAYLEQSQQALNEKNYDLAIEIAQQALDVLQQAENSEDVASQTLAAGALNKIGFAFYQQENYVSALDAFQKALAIYQEVNNLLGQADMLWEIAEVYIAQQEYKKARTSFEESLKVYRELDNLNAVGNALYWIGFIYYEQEDYELALDSFQEALVIYQEINNRLGQANMFWEIAEVYDVQQDYQKSRDNYQLSLELYREIDRKDAIGNALNRIALTHYRQNAYASALDFFQQALVIYQQTQNQGVEITLLTNIGDTYEQQQKYEDALDFYQQAFDLAKQTEKQDRAFNLALQISNLFRAQGAFYVDAEKLDEAIAIYGKALEASQTAFEISQELENSDHENRTLNVKRKILFSLAWVHRKRGQYFQATEYYQESLKVYRESQERLSDPNIEWEATTLWSIAIMLDAQELYAQALIFYQQALMLYREIESSTNTSDDLIETQGYISSILSQIGSAYEDQGNYTEALNFYQQVLKISQQLGDRSEEAYNLNSIGWIYRKLNLFERAQQFYQEALSAYSDSREISSNHPDLDWKAQVIWSIAHMLYKQEQYDIALEFYQQALKTYRQLKLSLDAVTEIDEIQGYESLLLSGIGDIYFQREKYADALSFYQQALTISQRSENRIQEVYRLRDIAATYRRLNQPENALRFYEQALTILRVEKYNLQASEQYAEASTLWAIANFYFDQKQYELALKLYQQSFVAYQGRPLDKAAVLRAMANTYGQLGQAEEASNAYQQALEQAQLETTIRTSDLANGTVSNSANNNSELQLHGVWSIETAQTSEGNSYTGTVSINPVEQSYGLLWQTSMGSRSGIAIADDGYLYVGWGDGDLTDYGVAVYRIGNDGSLIGQWADDQGFMGTEMATSTDSEPIEGQYSLTGLNVTGGQYKGTLSIQKNGDTYTLFWEIGGTEHHGIGLQSGNYLVVGWGLSGIPGVAAYQLTENRAIGQLAVLNQSALDTEVLVRNQTDTIEDYVVKILELRREASKFWSFGQLKVALDKLQQALTIARSAHDLNREVEILLSIGDISLRQEQFLKALDAYQNILTLEREVRNRSTVAIAFNRIGIAHYRQGQYTEALTAYQRALKIHIEEGDTSSIATLFSNIGLTYMKQGRFHQALEAHNKALNISHQEEDHAIGGSVLHNIGLAYTEQGQYDQAFESYQQALTSFQKAGVASFRKVRTLRNIGLVYANQGDYPQALSTLDEALVTQRSALTKNRFEEAEILSSIGQVKKSLGQYADALEVYQNALSEYQELGYRDTEGKTFRAIGTVYVALGEYEKALAVYEKALDIHREVGNRPEEIATLNNIGEIYSKTEQYVKALEIHHQALSIEQEIGSLPRRGRTLNNLGQAYRGLQRHSESQKAYEQALSILSEIGDRPGTAQVLSNLGKLLTERDQPELATVFLKRAVNTYEGIRKENRVLDRDLQSSYTETVADTYRQLADVLLTQGRIPEAQHVLDLLKIEELREFTSQTRAAWTIGGISLTSLEQEIQQNHGSLVALSQAIEDCNAVHCENRSELTLQRENLLTEYKQRIQTIEAAYRRECDQTDDQCVNPENLGNDAIKLLAAHDNAVLVYPLVVNNKLWLLWAAKNNVVGSIEVQEVNQEKLAQAVSEFRQGIEQGSYGYGGQASLELIQHQSQQLYDWLIRPLEAELAKNKIKHLIFAHDRYTRYIPMAALHDGEQYLIEKYAVSSILAALETDLDAPPTVSETSVLGLGLSDPAPPFLALENVPLELDGIVRETDSDSSGFYEGKVFLNDAFDKPLLRSEVYQHQILHIATHGKFEPGLPDKSFILLGNGDPLPIPEIDTLLQADLENVHLVVLSACETAYGEEGSDGREIAGLSSYFLKGNRAQAVMASLWAVNDASTSLLMQRFYEFLATGEFTKAEALQQAQLSLLYNQDVETRLEAVQRASVGVSTREDWPPAANTSIAHPYHWAPFILIGNAL